MTRSLFDSARPRLSCRPQLETLEDRLVPSTIAGSYADGVWRWDSTAGWSHISDQKANIVRVDAAGDVYGTFSDGLWRWDASTGAWGHLEKTSGLGDAEEFKVTASGVVYADFGTSGTWRWSFDGWQEISNLNVTDFDVSRSDVFFGRYDALSATGLWRWTPTVGWSHLTGNTPDSVLADDAGNFAGIFNTGIAATLKGTWRWNSSAGWARLSTSVATAIDLSDNGTLFENRGTGGIWRWNSGSFTEITTASGSSAFTVALSDGSVFMEFYNTSAGHYVGWYWNASTGWSNPFANTSPFFLESAGKDGDLFYGNATAGGTWRWSPTLGAVQLGSLNPSALGTQG
jgi:hypothetical protein